MKGNLEEFYSGKYLSINLHFANNHVILLEL